MHMEFPAMRKHSAENSNLNFGEGTDLLPFLKNMVKSESPASAQDLPAGIKQVGAYCRGPHICKLGVTA